VIINEHIFDNRSSIVISTLDNQYLQFYVEGGLWKMKWGGSYTPKSSLDDLTGYLTYYLLRFWYIVNTILIIKRMF
jgi:hypothetical protein